MTNTYNEEASMVRDSHKDQDYFNQRIAFCEYAVRESREDIRSSSMIKDYPGAAQELLLYIFRLVVLCFSRGDRVEDLRGPVMQWIDARELRAALHQKYLPPEERTPRTMYVWLTQDTAYECLAMLAFGRALRFNKTEMQRLLKAVGHEGEDALLDTAARALGDVDRGVAADCKFPKAYGKLLEVWQAPAEDRAAKLLAYSKGWMNKMRGTYWHGTLDSGDAYFGYWCFEIALTAMALDIDDSDLRKDKYYPADLVDAARGA